MSPAVARPDMSSAAKVKRRIFMKAPYVVSLPCSKSADRNFGIAIRTARRIEECHATDSLKFRTTNRLRDHFHDGSLQSSPETARCLAAPLYARRPTSAKCHQP